MEQMKSNRAIGALQSYLLIPVILLIVSGPLCAAETSKIQQAIEKAHRYLLRQKLTGPSGSLAATAYLKSGGDKSNPFIKQLIQEIFDKQKSGTYVPIEHHHYEAGVDLMLLEAVDAEAFRPQMQLIVKYLLEKQQSNGSWYYPYGLEPDCGDTSITQYAVMGLWAAVRSNIEIPTETFEKIARWHISKQKGDGGFSYHPFEQKVGPIPDYNKAIPSMTTAGTSSLLIVRRILFGNAEQDAEVRPTASKRRFGVLERFSEGKLSSANGAVEVKLASIDKSLKQSVRWMTADFANRQKRTEVFFTYRMYSIERVAALLDVATFGDYDWYEEGSNDLLLRQLADGSWDELAKPVAATSMALMFLSRATTTIVSPGRKISMVGSGLQAGGRGLPENLDSVEMKDGSITQRKIVGAVDNLLLELERSSDAKVADIQAADVETVQLEKPEDLIGQVDRLRRLAKDTRIEVRRTALWALGRSQQISAVPILISALRDADLSVVREASLGLCILPRLPEGSGKPIDPTEDAQLGLSESATVEQRHQVITKWQNDSIRNWTEWYQKNRPYDERDDRTTLRRTK